MLARFLLVVTMAVSAGVPRSDLRFSVVVNRSNGVTSLSRAELSAIMMKRTRSWRGGGEVLPVDQRAQSVVRENFSKAIHGKSAAYVVRYWQRLIFSGRAIPPRELTSDEEVIAFVKANRGAIGYVDAAATVGDEVKVIEVTE